MANPNPERQPTMTETKREALRDEIDKVRKEASEYQKANEDDEAFFRGLQLPIERWSRDHQRRYLEMEYRQAKLRTAQQSLTNLILDDLAESSNQLNVDVRELGRLTVQLDSDVRSLGSGIEEVRKSSRVLEGLTYMLIFVALITFAEAVVRNPPSPYFISLESLIASIMLVAGIKVRIIPIRRRKRSKSTELSQSKNQP